MNDARRWWPLPLRLLLGIGFIYHGYPKLFSAEGRTGFQGMLDNIGVPAPGLMAWVVGIIEFFGGIALIMGAATAVVAALLVINMLVAMFTVHLQAGFGFMQIEGMGPEGPVFGMPGVEVNLIYIAGLLALFIGGPGPLSVDDAATARRRAGLHREVHA